MKKHIVAGPIGLSGIRSVLEFRHHNPVARFVSTVLAFTITMLLVGVAFVGVAAPAQAASPCPTPGDFEIDGDMTELTCDPSGDDWNTPAIGVQSTTQGGTYSTSGKDDGNPTTWVSSGSTPDKTNFERAYATSRVVSGRFYVFVAWERSSTSGTQGYAIEIDNSGTRVGADGTPQPDRSNGGAVVYISSQGSSAPTFDSACKFTTQSDYGETCTSSNSNVTSAINTASISDPIAHTTQAAGSFFEVALDITGITGIAPTCPGSSAASVYLRSITGQASNGNLKGYMAPLSVAPNSTCVAPPISTTATPGGALNAPGSTQHDAVTVGTAAAPGVGSVKFYLCQPNQVTAGGCEGTAGTLVSTNDLDANGQASSGNVTGATTPNDNALGKYCWRAEFTPSANDHHYFGGKHTNSSTECFTVVHASPTISTQIAVTGVNAPGLGFTTLGDTAQLSGFVGSVDGGTVTFRLYGPNDATCTGTPVLTTTGTLNASGQATTTKTYQPTAVGKYTWIASYPGNALNDPIAGHCSDTNESATIVGAQVDVAKSANPPGPVSAGTDIGFDITVTNDGAVPAKGVHVTDNLPAGADGVSGGDLDWEIDPSYTGCSITGAVGSQVLDCTFSQVNGPGSLPVIHVTSPTSPADCGVVKNKASITTTNGTGGDSDVATVTVRCADLTLTKTADHASVDAGSQIGFTVTAANSGATGTGTATGVVINDPLPAGTGVDWSIESGPNNCAITGAVGSEVLHCSAVDLDPGDSEVVHVVSGTSFASCAAYPNTASLTATNHASLQASASTTVRCPDLSLTKTADNATVDAGSQIGFTITASNSGAPGTGTATGVVINDPLPAGAGVDWSIATGPNNCAITGAVGSEVLHCTAADLAAGASETIHVVSGTSYASCADYPNTASLNATNHASLQASASTTVRCPDLSLTKTADNATVDAGSQIGFTITASNSGDAGTGVAKGVVINDPLPAGTGVDWSIASGPGNCAITGAVGSEVLQCTAVDLAAGASESVHVVSGTSFASCKAYPNTASLTAGNHPNLTASATTTVRCPDVTLTKTADAGSVNAGSQIGFTITAANSGDAGTGLAEGVVINDPLPAGPGVDWSIESGADNCAITGSVGSEVLHCTAVDLAAGASESVHVVSGTSFASCKAYPNSASLTATNHPNLTDSATTTVLCPGLNLTKTADAASVDAGSQIGFTITATNSAEPGTGVAEDVVINDPLPAGGGVDWSIATGPGNCSITGSVGSEVLHCTAVDLAPGASESVHVVSGTSFASCTAYPNTASLTAANSPDATAGARTTVLCPDVTLTKTADAGSVSAGSQIGFTITASNSDEAGTGDAVGVVIEDLLPAGSGVNWSIQSGSGNCTIDGAPSSQTLHCTGVTLAPGASVSVHVVSGTSAVSCKAYPNTAHLSATNHPSLEDSATTTVLCPGLTIVKDADAESVNAGSPIGFTVTATNTGDGTATGVLVNDPLPTGPGITWTIESQTGPLDCELAGGILSCTGSLIPGAHETVHVTSPTQWTRTGETEVNSCLGGPDENGVYPNLATVTATNVVGSQNDDATTRVLCPDLSIVKTADADSVSAGSPIGFTVTASNGNAAGTGDAIGVVINDPLPAGPGVTWSIESGADNCAVQGTAPTQTLHCSAVDLAPGESESVHLTSPTQWTTSGETVVNSCLGGPQENGVYPNTATLTATNEPAMTDDATTRVLCPDVTLVKTADADSVSAGSPIGFTVTATNAGPGTATGVLIDDPLPSGPGITWSIESESGPLDCAIAAGSLSCTGALAADDVETVHVTSPTEWSGSGEATVNSCLGGPNEDGVYPNTATLTSTNHPSLDDDATTAVLCPDVTLAKTADAASVNAGGQIGFRITATNSAAEGTGTATGLVIDDPLPAGSGVSWTIASGPESCSIQGSAPTQTLHCDSIDLAPGGSESVHVVSATTIASCKTYPNAASLAATNHPSLTARATTAVTNCIIVSPPKPPVVKPPHVRPPAALPNTGGPDAWLLTAGLVLVLGGGMLVAGDRRRRRRS